MLPKNGFLNSFFTKFIKVSVLIVLLFGNLATEAQPVTNQNSLNLRITKVTKNKIDELTRQTSPNNWVYDGDLGPEDAIKYAWSGVDLNLNYKTKPAKSGGYLKVFLNDDSNDTNLITEFGSSPLPISSLTQKLQEGENKLLFAFIDSNNRTTARVNFNFKFRNTNSSPTLEILQPSPGSVLAKGIDQNFVIKLTRFTLEANNSNQENRGKLNIYINEVKPGPNLLQTLNFSKDLGNNEAEVNFNTKDLDLAKLKIPDNTASRLIFVLTKNNGELLPYRAETTVQTNYSNSLDVGFPRISIIEPRKDRTELQIDGERKFILQIDNFNILPERKEGPNENKTGYLQIFVDDSPRRIIYPKNEFTLNELGINNLGEGKKSVKVQLVNKDFTRLIPEATDSIDIILAQKNQPNTQETPQVQNNNWRLVIVSLTVILVVGGIMVLIAKG